jgi:hypothetical protein
MADPMMCTLPRIQIDTWNTESSTPTSSKQLAAKLFETPELIAMSLLVGSGAQTIPDLRRCIAMIHEPLAPEVKEGQVYLNTGWRIRYKDMDKELKRIVLNCNERLDFSDEYSPELTEACVYRIIGPARQAGTRQCPLYQPQGQVPTHKDPSQSESL